MSARQSFGFEQRRVCNHTIEGSLLIYAQMAPSGIVVSILCEAVVSGKKSVIEMPFVSRSGCYVWNLFGAT